MSEKGAECKALDSKAGAFLQYAGTVFPMLLVPEWQLTNLWLQNTLDSLLIIFESNFEPRGRTICHRVDEELSG